MLAKIDLKCFFNVRTSKCLFYLILPVLVLNFIVYCYCKHFNFTHTDVCLSLFNSVNCFNREKKLNLIFLSEFSTLRGQDKIRLVSNFLTTQKRTVTTIVDNQNWLHQRSASGVNKNVYLHNNDEVFEKPSVFVVCSSL